jgi:hypothetical protein
MRYFEIVKPPAWHIRGDADRKTPPGNRAVVGQKPLESVVRKQVEVARPALQSGSSRKT